MEDLCACCGDQIITGKYVAGAGPFCAECFDAECFDAEFCGPAEDDFASDDEDPRP